jgi:hypothetical protein
MKAGSRPQYYRIRRMVQMVREGTETGYLPNSSDLTSSGVDKIFSIDSGATWTTTEILSGTFTGIADNAGVVDAVYLMIPEPSTAALILGAGGLALLLRRRRSR